MAASSVSRQLTLALLWMFKSSLIISSAFSACPVISTSTLASLGGVAESSTIHGRIEAFERLLGVDAVRLVAFVQDD